MVPYHPQTTHLPDRRYIIKIYNAIVNKWDLRDVYLGAKTDVNSLHALLQSPMAHGIPIPPHRHFAYLGT